MPSTSHMCLNLVTRESVWRMSTARCGLQVYVLGVLFRHTVYGNMKRTPSACRSSVGMWVFGMNWRLLSPAGGSQSSSPATFIQARPRCLGLRAVQPPGRTEITFHPVHVPDVGRAGHRGRRSRSAVRGFRPRRSGRSRTPERDRPGGRRSDGEPRSAWCGLRER